MQSEGQVQAIYDILIVMNYAKDCYAAILEAAFFHVALMKLL